MSLWIIVPLVPAKLAPREAVQFGKALKRILRCIVEAPPLHGPMYLLKIDIAD
jgi:hypothetical protein